MHTHDKTLICESQEGQLTGLPQTSSWASQHDAWLCAGAGNIKGEKKNYKLTAKMVLSRSSIYVQIVCFSLQIANIRY